MGVAHVSQDLDPVLYLIVGIDTACVTFVVGIGNDTAVIQETCARIVVEPVFRAAYRNIVLLSEGIMVRLIIPVVRSIVVLAVAVSERGFRISLSLSMSAFIVWSLSLVRLRQITRIVK